MQPFLLRLPEGQKILLNKQEIIIGRSQEADVRVSLEHESRKHCLLFRKGNKYWIRDLSSNGTFLNSRKIESEKPLKQGDSISLSVKGSVFQYKEERTLFEKIINNKIILILSILFFISSLLAVTFFIQYQNQLPGNFKKNYQEIKSHFALEHFPEDREHITIIYNKMISISKMADIELRKKNREKYLSRIEEIFKQEKIPRIYTSIAFVESGFTPKAYNRRSGAAGMWQLMPPTAREYGLTVNRQKDERFNFEASTRACCKYIKDLIAIFGDSSFGLVLAAYNAGDGRIRYALRQVKDPLNERNFWYLYDKKLIPEETREYVSQALGYLIYERMFLEEDNKRDRPKDSPK